MGGLEGDVSAGRGSEASKSRWASVREQGGKGGGGLWS